MTPFKKTFKRSKKLQSGPRPLRYFSTGLSKENVEYAHDQGWFDMGLGEGFSDSGDSIEKHHHEKCLRARAEETKRHRQGLAMTSKENSLVDAGARAKLLGEGELPDLDHSP